MSHRDFDRLIERRPSGSFKWGTYDADVIPMWVADMDFRAPEAVVNALRQRVDHGIFGYELPSAHLKETICQYLHQQYLWHVAPEQILFLPGIVSAFNQACRAFAAPGEGVMSPSPVYPPVLKAPGNFGMRIDIVEMASSNRDGRLHYQLDCDALETNIKPDTSLFILCHPQNPTGREFSRQELAKLAEICLRHQMVICSDEIHCDLMLDGRKHVPLASLGPEIGNHCVTLMAPSKTFNIPSLGSSFAIIQNPELRRRFKLAGEGIVPWVNSLGLTATLAAYQHGGEWLQQLKEYLTQNRDFLLESLDHYFPTIKSSCPEATYLAWLDCRELNLAGSPHEFFLKQARVAFNDGVPFGPGGKGFVRLNFGCPRTRLQEALQRMKNALDARNPKLPASAESH
jgi:cystathionine beta-lyase